MVARLMVDLAQFRTNIHVLRRRIAPADLMLVVKADAYGHGIERIVATAAAEGVRWFGAFDITTAVRARAVLGHGTHVFAWVTMTRSEIELAARHRITLGVGDSQYLERIAEVSRGRAVPVHLKIDTGLHRSGIRPENWQAAVARAAELQHSGDIAVEGVWSHIAEASDDDDDDAREAFLDAVSVVESARLSPVIRHLAASAAGAARPEFRFDLVRFGAFAYGIRPVDGDAPAGVLPIGAVNAPVIRVDADTVTIGCGSLDGLFSTASGRIDVGTPAGARRLIHVGDVESTVSSWPGATLGDEVTVWGPGNSGERSATDLAEVIGTVGEEVMVRLSPSLPRYNV